MNFQDELYCHNCFLKGHKSERCREEAQHSRCPQCNKVGFHLEHCSNKRFVSQPRNITKTVFALQNLLRLHFDQVETEFNVHDVRATTEISRTPLWLSTADAFVGKIDDRSLEFAITPMKRHITLFGKNQEPFLSLVFFHKQLVVNDRFKIDEKGTVVFHCNSTNSITEKNDCEILVVETSDIFNVRLDRHGFTHNFTVYPDIGLILVDPRAPDSVPQQMPPQEPQEVDNRVVAANVAFTGGQKDERVFTVRIDLPGVDLWSNDDLGNLLRKTMVTMALEHKGKRREAKENERREVKENGQRAIDQQ